ncbi:MAG TPA: hypothetical protein VN771_05320 [Candidatus Baltobacteraceae bacterium]|nr:hypothetical protein [Candidatus Baltobacteraceae bacterium]
MRVRLFQLRLIAAFLLLLWASAVVGIFALYHPGGPVDRLMGVAALGPVAVAALAVRYPPLAVGDRSSVVMGWLGVLACLVLIPVLFGAFQAMNGGGDAALVVPSPEAMYAGAAALVLTCLFAGLGMAQRLVGGSADRQRRLVVGVSMAMALTLVSGSLLGGAILVNGLALEAAAPPSSIYGPVGTATTPPLCGGALTAGPYAVVDITATATVDQRQRATSTVTGRRAGTDESWQATGTRDGLTSSRAYVEVGGTAWDESSGSGSWRAVPLSVGRTAPAPTLDEAVVEAALTPALRIAAEDVGFEVVGGATARHCRTQTTGSLALDGFPELEWLAETSAAGGVPDLHDWRGQLDWWVFADGELGMATVQVSGLPPDSWPGGGVQGFLQAMLTATDRTTPVAIQPPPGVAAP